MALMTRTGLLVAAVVAATSVLDAATSAWPRTIAHADATVVIYQPQVDRFDGDELEGRVAVAVTAAGSTEPEFGAVWLTARVETDRDARLVRVVDVKVENLRLPDASDDARQQLGTLLESEVPRLEIVMDLDLLLADLAEAAPSGVDGLRNDPPTIIVRQQPAVLILVDGEPVYQQVGESSVERVVNTPFLVARFANTHYLASDNGWFEARAIVGPWRAISRPPAPVGELAEEQARATRSERRAAAGLDARVPEIVVSFAPAELIFVDGQPLLAPVGDGDLLIVTNTDSDLVFAVDSRAYFVLLSGRWYRSRTLGGPWEWVANDALPPSFAAIPDDSDIGYLRASVAGTEESREAMLDQVIPQTTAVRRDDSSLEVAYDGSPKFVDVDGTPLRYAVNTASSVLWYGGIYYACDQGVWYEAAAPTGPWLVSVSVPPVMYTIPPSSPVYNVTYVRVYSATPEVVYVGYTPGYLGSYVAHGAVVYGTGWHYRPWWDHHYYPRPVTWGYHVRYNPWYGWSFGLSYSTCPFAFTIGWGHSWSAGWWGPGWYRPYPWYGSPYGYGYRDGYRHGYWHGQEDGHGHPSRDATAPPSRSAPSTRSSSGRSLPPQNVYARDVNRARLAPVPSTDRVRTVPAPNRPNDVITDQDGTVFRRGTSSTWERRESGRWQPSTAPAGDATRLPASEPSGSPSTGGTPRPRTDPARVPSADRQRPPSTGGTARPGSDTARSPDADPKPPSSPGATTRPPSPPPTSTVERDWAARQRGQERAQTYRSAPAPRAAPPAPKVKTPKPTPPPAEGTKKKE